MPRIYTPTVHPRIEQRKRQGPVKVRDVMKKDSPIARLNTWVAVKVTKGVGTMWCAYAFAALAIVSLPAAIASGNPASHRLVDQPDLPAARPAHHHHRRPECPRRRQRQAGRGDLRGCRCRATHGTADPGPSRGTGWRDRKDSRRPHRSEGNLRR